VVGILLAKNLLLDKIKVLPDSMFLYCKSWIKYHKWNLDEYFLSGIKFQIVFQVWSLFHPSNIVNVNPWNFIDWKFTNDISWMFIHNMEYNLLGYLRSSLYLYHKSTLPNHEPKLTLLFYQIAKSTLLQDIIPFF